MTKKHFVELADVIRDHQRRAERIHLIPFDPDHTDALADFCASQNPAFDRARWLAYIAGDCGPSGGKR